MLWVVNKHVTAPSPTNPFALKDPTLAEDSHEEQRLKWERGEEIATNLPGSKSDLVDDERGDSIIISPEQVGIMTEIAK